MCLCVRERDTIQGWIFVSWIILIHCLLPTTVKSSCGTQHVVNSPDFILSVQPFVHGVAHLRSASQNWPLEIVCHKSPQLCQVSLIECLVKLEAQQKRDWWINKLLQFYLIHAKGYCDCTLYALTFWILCADMFPASEDVKEKACGYKCELNKQCKVKQSIPQHPVLTHISRIVM